MKMSNRERLQCALLALSTSLFIGTIVSGVSGNLGVMEYTLVGGNVFAGASKLLNDERDELIVQYEKLASANPEELEIWMDTLTDEELEYIYGRVTQS